MITRTQKLTEWTIIFCSDCGEPTPPKSGLITPFGFICDDCLNYRSLHNQENLDDH